jgi:hypothetical protein
VNVNLGYRMTLYGIAEAHTVSEQGEDVTSEMTRRALQKLRRILIGRHR